MKYDAQKEDSVNSFDLEFLSESDHEVFYIITPPKDYEFDKKKITKTNGLGEKLQKIILKVGKIRTEIYFTLMSIQILLQLELIQ